jgi:hypothetical protein
MPKIALLYSSKNTVFSIKCPFLKGGLLELPLGRG